MQMPELWKDGQKSKKSEAFLVGTLQTGKSLLSIVQLGVDKC